MFGGLPYYSSGLIMLIVCSTSDIAEGITVYEYGIHVEGEDITFALNGVLPMMTQIIKVNATPTKPGFENKLSFVKVEYNSPMSPVEITFKPATSTLVFYVRFPFIDIPYGIVGYSLRAKPGKKLRSGSKCQCNRNIQRLLRSFRFE